MNTNEKEFDLLVFVGRFQPFHKNTSASLILRCKNLKMYWYW
jgi:hypothetical protein